MPLAKARAVFLDRDGTLVEDVGYPRDPRQVRLLPGAGEALARLQAEGFLLVVVSNQSGIGRGLVTTAEAGQVHSRLVAVLDSCGVRLAGAYYCPHAPEQDCRCRKPSPEMIVRAAGELGIEPARSFMVGDKLSDAEAGRRAGCRTLLLAGDPASRLLWPAVDETAAGWPDLVQRILIRKGVPA